MRGNARPILLMWLALMLACSAFATERKSQPSRQDTTPHFIFRGIAEKEVTLTAADLDKLPHQSVKVKDKSGEDVVYDGVLLGDVMKKAGLDLDADQHGRGLTRYLLVEAADKYRIVYSLAEIDPAFTDRVILLATARDGKPISDQEGPFRIIVPDDKRPARWVRQVRILTLVDAVSPADRNKKP